MIFQALLHNPVGLLFSVIAIGILIGEIPLGRLKLGGSGVLVAGLFFGHFGYVLPDVIQTVGVVLFVYAIGLRSGPYIINSFRDSRGNFLVLALVIVVSAAGTAMLLRALFGLSPRLAVGIYAGAMTSTPALAAAIEALGDSSASVGYGLAYPLGILVVILMVQVLPRILRVSLEDEAARHEAGRVRVPIIRKVFCVSNENVTHASIAETLHGLDDKFRIVRVKRGGRIFTPHADETLKAGDRVLTVGPAEALERLRIIIGEEVQDEIPYSEEADSRWTVITSRKFAGRKIGNLEISHLYGVILTRVRRGNVEFVPSSGFTLEPGDEVRVSGIPGDIQRFEDVVKRDRDSQHETDIFTFALGLTLGVLFGLVRIPLPGGLALSLGIAGGPLVAGLLFGYYGRFGKLSGRVPKAALLITGELGLYLFLAVAGCSAGVSFVHILKDQGIFLILLGAVITVVPVLTAVLVGRFVMKINLLTLLGMICGGMTSTPALGVLTTNTRSEIPALGYTGIYPLAVLLTTIAAQLLVRF